MPELNAWVVVQERDELRLAVRAAEALTAAAERRLSDTEADNAGLVARVAALEEAEEAARAAQDAARQEIATLQTALQARRSLGTPRHMSRTQLSRLHRAPRRGPAIWAICCCVPVKSSLVYACSECVWHLQCWRLSGACLFGHMAPQAGALACFR